MSTRSLLLLLLFYQANCEISMKVIEHVFSIEAIITGLSDDTHNCTILISDNNGIVDKCENCTSCIYRLFENLNPETFYTVTYNLHEDPYYNGTIIVMTEQYLMKIYHENPYDFFENVSVVPSAFGAGDCLARCMAFDIDLFNCVGGFCSKNCDQLEFQFKLTQTTDILCNIKTKSFQKEFNFSFTAERTFPAVTDVFSIDGQSITIIMKSTDKFKYNTSIFLTDVVTDNILNNTLLETPETRVYFGDLINEASYKVEVTFKIYTSDCLVSNPDPYCIHTDSVTLTLYNPSDLKPPALNVTIAPDLISLKIPHPKEVLHLFGNVTCYLYVYGRIKTSDHVDEDILDPEHLKMLQVGFWGFISEMDSLTCKSKDDSFFKPDKITYLSWAKNSYFTVQVSAIFTICEKTRCYSSKEYKYASLESENLFSSKLIFTTFIALFALIIILHLVFLISASDRYHGVVRAEKYEVASDAVETVKKQLDEKA